MNQYKSIFLGTVDPASPFAKLKKAVNSQKCIRAGGKHNGTLSLSRYTRIVYSSMLCHSQTSTTSGKIPIIILSSRCLETGPSETTSRCESPASVARSTDGWESPQKEATAHAWHLLTTVYGLPADRLYVTYFEGGFGLPADTETRDFWLGLGVQPDRILTGNAADNFWGSVVPFIRCGSFADVGRIYSNRDGSYWTVRTVYRDSLRSNRRTKCGTSRQHGRPRRPRGAHPYSATWV